MFILPPRLESHRYDTYGVVVPKATHTRSGKCEEMNMICTSITNMDEQKVFNDAGTPNLFEPKFCPERHCGHWAHGWVTALDVSTELGQKQARYIIDQSGRHWKAQQDGSKVQFFFLPGQQCFTDHRIPLEREPLFTFKHSHLVTAERATVINGREWLDRFGQNQLNLKETIERG